MSGMHARFAAELGQALGELRQRLLGMSLQPLNSGRSAAAFVPSGG